MGELKPETKKYLFGLISVDGYLEPSIPLNPCRICGGTERYLTHTKILGIHRWLIYCVPCELGTEPKRYPHQACIACNNNELYNKIRERINNER